jgi:predicted transcriptional regulator
MGRLKEIYKLRQLLPYRTKTEYIAEILNATLEGEQKARAILRICPSHKQQKQMLEKLQELNWQPYTKTHDTTNNGKRFWKCIVSFQKVGSMVNA